MIWGTVPRESCYNNAIFNECYIEAIAGPFYNIMKVMMKGPNKQLNTKKKQATSEEFFFTISETSVKAI